MRKTLWVSGSIIFALSIALQAQAPIAPRSPFTIKDAERGKQLQAKSDEIRGEIVKLGHATPAEPFKILGNLYSVGVLNGKAYLLTSPQGHILLGAAYANAG